jgi:translocon-associated protein subunit alpha
MGRGLRITALLLLLACALLLQAFGMAVSSVEETEAHKGEVVDEPEPEQFVEATLKPAPGVKASASFPRSPNKVVKGGEATQIFVEIENDGPSTLKVAYTRATLHRLHDHRLIVQNFTFQEGSTVVDASSRGNFNYLFSINKFLQPGRYDLVGHVVYEMDGNVYRNVFHNGTIDVVEGGSFVKGETIFLSSLGLGLLGLIGMWIHSKVQEFIKKQRRSNKKVETGTRTSCDANEWLQGTSITQKLSRNISQQRKSFKKKPNSKDIL